MQTLTTFIFITISFYIPARIAYELVLFAKVQVGHIANYRKDKQDFLLLIISTLKNKLL